MNIQRMCAATDTITNWNEIDFKKAEKSVKKLQKRIAVAYKNHRYDVVMYLQNRLIHSFNAKALAVKCVTSNRGKNTPGIDNVIWNTDELKFDAIRSLKRRGYKPSPLRRIYIPKSNGKYRALSIPTMKDRAMETLYRFALEPIAELTADECSYAYRPNRSAKDAILKCCDIVENITNMKWMIKLDIASCFDTINHTWLMEHIFMDKVVLEKMIKTPYWDNSILCKPLAGIPQGGSLSSVLCNMTLDGIEQMLYEKYDFDVQFVRYADDMMIFVSCHFPLVQDVLLTVEDFLSQRGLHLSDEKTQIKELEQPVNFLGCTLVRGRNRMIVVPSRTKIDSLLSKIENILLDNFDNFPNKKSQWDHLKSVITGWINYYYGIVEQTSLYEVEFEIMILLNRIKDTRFAGSIQKLFSEKY